MIVGTPPNQSLYSKSPIFGLMPLKGSRKQKKTVKPPTLADVAKFAGVSTATVSRAISNPEVLKGKTKQRVQEAIEKTGYVVNEAARSLRKNKAGAILVMVPAASSQFFSLVLSGLESEASKSDYNILVANTGDDFEKEKQLFNYVKSKKADGVLIFSGRFPSLNELVEDSFTPPVVAVNQRIDKTDIPTVAVDGYQAAKIIVKFLHGMGHERIGHVSGPSDRISSALDRLNGYRDGVNELGIKSHWIYKTEYNIESGVSAAREWISLTDRPSAVFCSCDEVAYGFNSMLYRSGFRVPKDVSVVGFDDIPLSEFSIPSLTTYHQPYKKIGIQAVKKLLQQIKNPKEKLEDEFIQGELLIRESTKRLEKLS